jgi:hypothetical protein
MIIADTRNAVLNPTTHLLYAFTDAHVIPPAHYLAVGIPGAATAQRIDISGEKHALCDLTQGPRGSWKASEGRRDSNPVTEKCN